MLRPYRPKIELPRYWKEPDDAHLPVRSLDQAEILDTRGQLTLGWLRQARRAANTKRLLSGRYIPSTQWTLTLLCGALADRAAYRGLKGHAILEYVGDQLPLAWHTLRTRSPDHPIGFWLP